MPVPSIPPARILTMPFLPLSRLLSPLSITAILILLIIPQRSLQRLIHLIPLLLLHAQRLQIRIRTSPLRHRQPQRPQHRILLRLLHLPPLRPHLLPFLLRPLFRRQLRVVGLGVPAEVFVFLPTTHGRHERVAEVVFAVLAALHIVPGEVHAAARTFLADGLEEVHI